MDAGRGDQPELRPGRPSVALAYPNGLDADLSFEAQTGRLASINHRAGSRAAPIASYDHGYDARGDLATLAELTSTKTFSYDKQNLLLRQGRTADWRPAERAGAGDPGRELHL